jgi:REP element-mobilizing transposase RayT
MFEKFTVLRLYSGSMKAARENHRRRSIRLREYDYRQAGAYFITVVAYGRAALFGTIEGSEARLNEFGRIVERSWIDLPEHYSGAQCDAFVVMPNHVHGIIVLDEPVVGAGFKPAPTRRHGLPEIVRALKTFSARRINEMRHTPAMPVWQRNYYEHVIRGDEELLRVREYILNNPLEWEHDRENPSRSADLKPTRTAEAWQV